MRQNSIFTSKGSPLLLLFRSFPSTSFDDPDPIDEFPLEFKDPVSKKETTISITGYKEEVRGGEGKGGEGRGGRGAKHRLGRSDL